MVNDTLGMIEFVPNELLTQEDFEGLPRYKAKSVRDYRQEKISRQDGVSS